MIREVNLVSYLPPFLREYETLITTLQAENPEFMLAWKVADRIIRNEFIETAAEDGIARFEKMLNMVPRENEDLEMRRARVQSKWFVQAPYTMKTLCENLAIVCRGRNFKIAQTGDYRVEAHISVEAQMEELLKDVGNVLENYLPANLEYQVYGMVKRKRETKIYVGGRMNLWVKVKAGSEKKNSHSVVTSHVRTGTATINHVKIKYQVERTHTWQEQSLQRKESH